MPLTKEDAYGTFIDIDGTQTELDQRTCEAVRTTLRVIQGGKSSSGRDAFVSTGVAAEILGISRRTLTRLLDAGEMRYERQGHGHRRVRISDVLAYREESQRRRQALEKMRHDASEYGIDDLDLESGYLDQFLQKG